MVFLMNNWQKYKTIFSNAGILSVDNIPSNVINYLNQNITDIKFNHTLAGHIEKEYSYSNWPDYIDNFILKHTNENILKEYYNKLKFVSIKKPLYLKSLWVNLQKKHEFNPIHDHIGVYSFIIFLKIPYDLENENKVFPKNSDIEPSTSKLSFLLTDNLGDIVEIKISVDKSFENKMIMFPSKMKHLVYPFYTSDDLRMTVSGNVLIED